MVRHVFARFPLACAVAFFAALPAQAGFSLSFDRAADAYSRRWALEAGAAWIVSNPLREILRGEINIDSGIRGGNIYVLSASYLIGELELNIGERTFRPQIDLPLTLEIFDEHERSPFFSYNAAIRGRWVDFPWNHIVRTTIGKGVGPSYSEKIPRMEYRRALKNKHKDRSHLKFTVPLDVTFAHPEYPQHQLVLFVAHQSAGPFGSGGLNALGIGYRWGFE